MKMRAFLLLLMTAVCAFAHNPDTSYVRVRFHPDRLELRFAFDAFELQKIVPSLDADGDLALSRAELNAAAPAIQDFLRKHAGIEVNGAAAELGEALPPFWPLDAPDPIPARVWHAAESLISFGFDRPSTAPVKDVALIFDVFETLGQQHRVFGFFEHGGRPHEVIFTAAQPDYLFDTAYSAAPDEGRRGNANTSPMREFLWQGVLHIWEGYDHLCFLLALLVVSRLGQIVGIITAFTVAHSITLTLAALKIVELPARLVEAAIAASILYVAVENLVRREPAHRWVLTFIFGLIHGFGFANVLGELELPQDSFVRCMFMFNVGVELGQLAVVFALLPFGWLVMRRRHGERVKTAVSIGVGLLGLAWLVDRVFDLEMMPF